MIFHTADLYNSHGYDGLLDGLLESNGFTRDDASVFAPPGSDADFDFFQMVLVFVALAFVVPELDEPLDPVIAWSGNPVRAGRPYRGVPLTPHTVDVPDDKILRLAAALCRTESD